MKNSSLKSFVSSICDRRELSLFTALAAAGPEPRGADDRPNSLKKRDKRERRFSQRKRLTMNALHSLEKRARVLFAQRISRVCHLVSETLTRIGTPPKAFHNTHTSETKSPEDKKRMTCSTGALLCPQTLICLRHRLPTANVKCIVCFIHASETGHAEGVPIAPSRGRSVEVPFGREHTFHNLTSLFHCFIDALRVCTSRYIYIYIYIWWICTICT